MMMASRNSSHRNRLSQRDYEIMYEEVNPKHTHNAAPRAGPEVHRKLDARHLEMIAIGGTIGTGLFLASGNSIATAGSLGALLSYAVVGIMVYFVVAALGEMATLIPISGSFNTYSSRFVDPALGFTMGVNYWLSWAVTLPAEIVAATMILNYWFPDFPLWVWCAAFLIILFLLNILGVKSFGEAEFWFALIKVAAVVIFIIVGAVVVIKDGIGFKNYSVGEGPFVGGVSGTMAVFTNAFFAYGGTELVGITAGEAKNPRKTVPKAINGTFWRICIFYILAIFIIGLLIPYNDPNLMQEDVAVSPFTVAFAKAHIPVANHIMNAIILVAVLSAGNSSMYASSRTLMGLASEGLAPSIFMKTSRGVPIIGLVFAVMWGCISFLAIAFGRETVFQWLFNLTGLSTLITWINIAVTHIRFRYAYRAQGYDEADLPYRAPWFPYGSILSIFMGLVILGGKIYFGIRDSTDIKSVISVFIGIPLYLGCFIFWKLYARTKLVPLTECDFKTGHVGDISHDDDDEEDSEHEAGFEMMEKKSSSASSV